MKSTILVLVLAFPAIGLGQSLADVAKKEKARRENNKKQGKEATVLSEEDVDRLRPIETTVGGGPDETGSEGSTGGSYEPSSEELASGEFSEGEEDVPTSIPPDLPLAQRIDMFERMKRHYLARAGEIDQQIRENETKIRKAQADLASASAAGGAGLPVAPGAAPVGGQLTGQESVGLAEELNRLQTINKQLQTQKDQLKLDLQEKGRVAGIPPGYLRF